MLTRALTSVSPSLSEAASTAREEEAPPAAAPPLVALSQGMLAGEEWAFREFHRQYFDRLYRLALVLTRGDETAAADVVQDTTCRVARHVRRFDDPTAFWCWLSVLMRSSVRDAGRKRQRYWRLLADYAARWLPIQTPAAPEADRVLEQALIASLPDLDPLDRALLEGKYLARLSTRELAERHNLSEKAVENRLGRARQRLREHALRRLKDTST